MSVQLERQMLPPEAQEELKKGAEWLLTTAQFEPLQKENYSYCVDAQALVDQFSKVLAYFNDKV